MAGEFRVLTLEPVHEATHPEPVKDPAIVIELDGLVPGLLEAQLCMTVNRSILQSDPSSA